MGRREDHQPRCGPETGFWPDGNAEEEAHPQDLPADVGSPLLLQRVSLGVLDEIRH